MVASRPVCRPSSYVVPANWRALGWNRLLRVRGWLQSSADLEPSLDAAVTKLSRELSFPLTVAHAWPALGVHACGSGRPLRLCVLGAREEADSVSIAAWLELCLLAEAAPHMSLSMIGPEARGDERSASADALRVTQSTPCPTTFAESSLGSALLAGRVSEGALPDAFCLFNPGLHAGKYSWRPSIQAVLATEVPVLLTAYSEQDAASDAQWLRSLCGGARTPEYVANPWASLEPWSSSGGDERANKYVAVLHGAPDAVERLGGTAAPAPRAGSVVPTEQAWLRRAAMRDFFDEGPKMLAQSFREWWDDRRTDRG